MPPSVTTGIDFTALLLGLTAVLSAVTAFFLARFVSKQDAFFEKTTDVLTGILSKLAVHDEKHERHDARLEHLETRKK